MKNGFKLMYQKGLSPEEQKQAIDKFQWFIKESFNPQTYDERQKKFVPQVNVQLPCWKQMTRGGHPNGLPIQTKS